MNESQCCKLIFGALVNTACSGLSVPYDMACFFDPSEVAVSFQRIDTISGRSCVRRSMSLSRDDRVPFNPPQTCNSHTKVF
jgi:hypothetical protein